MLQNSLMYNLPVEKTNLIVICFLKNYPIGYRFTKWPNHITIVPYFNTGNATEFINNLKSSCESLGTIICNIGEIVEIGHNNGVPANLVKSEGINILFSIVSKEAFSHDKLLEEKLTNRKFLPHITHNDLPYPIEGDKFEIEEVYIVEKLSQNTKEKIVLEKIKLS